MSGKNFLKLLSKLIANIKDELLSFSIVTILFLVKFPQERILITVIFAVASSIYALLKLKYAKKDENVTKQFNKYLGIPDNWQKKFQGNREYWVYKNNPLFHIEIGENLVRGFKEPWMRKYPDMANNYSFKVYLKFMNTVVHDFVFVALDGVRYTAPLPERERGVYYYEKNSLKFKTANVIGQFYRYKDIKEFALSHKIKLR